MARPWIVPRLTHGLRLMTSAEEAEDDRRAAAASGRCGECGRPIPEGRRECLDCSLGFARVAENASP